MTLKNFSERIKLLGRKMYLAHTSIRFLMFFSVLVLVAYLFFPEKMTNTVAFVTAVVSAFTSIILAAIGANYMITKKFDEPENKTQDLNIVDNPDKDGDNDEYQ